MNTGSLFFPHISQFSDKWEGLLTRKTREELFKEEYAKYNNSELAAAGVEQYERSRENFYLLCWHMNDHESYLMWKVYANRGCAIQTNYERLVASFSDSPREVNGCVVKYIDYERDPFPIGNVYSSVSYKDVPYRDEKEFRLLYWKVALQNQGYHAGDRGVEIGIDTDMLIQNIYINPGEDIDVAELRKALETAGIRREIRQSRILMNVPM